MTSALKPHAHVFVCNAVNVILFVSIIIVFGMLAVLLTSLVALFFRFLTRSALSVTWNC